MATHKAHLLCTLLCFALFSSVSTSSPLVLPLTHSLSGKTQFASTHHLLKSTSARSAARFRNHHKQHQQQHPQQRQVSLPLSPGSDYTLSFTLNASPPQTVSLFLDTGSDLVWFPCRPFECVLCEDKQPPMTSSPVNLTSTSATKVHCKAPSCSAAHSNLPSSDLCAISGCHLASIEISNCKSSPCPPFYYAYGDGSLVGRLYTDSITLEPPLVIPKFTFACSHSALAEPVGVAGFGRGLLSLPAQLAASSPEIGNRFSYCLVSHSFNSNRTALPSPLILGRAPEQPDDDSSDEKTDSKFAYTPLLDNPKNPYFYSVGLDGVSVGGRNIPAPSLLREVDEHGTGGVVVDSGTTFTMLPSGFYTKVVDGFNERMAGYVRAKEVEENTGLGPCYYAKNGGALDVPGVVLRFSGSASSVALPKRNYFYEFVDESEGKGKWRSKRVGCMMLMNGGDENELRGGPGATLGNYQQQGFEVVYDLEMNRVGFARRKCASLWERLNRGGV